MSALLRLQVVSSTSRPYRSTASSFKSFRSEKNTATDADSVILQPIGGRNGLQPGVPCQKSDVQVVLAVRRQKLEIYCFSEFKLSVC